MSETIMRTGLDGSGYAEGARVVTKANLDMEQSTNKTHGAMTALEGRFGSIGSSSVTGFGAAKSALNQLQTPLDNMKSMLEQVESRIIRIGATVLIFRAIGAAVGVVNSFFREGIKDVQEYQDTLIAMSASLTQIAILNNKNGKSLPQMYAESARYAGALAEKMREVDINSSANYEQIMNMLQVYTSTGRVLDINNKRQIDGFTALSNAIPALTKGQDVTRQMNTEMRAFATGSLTAGSMIARMVDAMAKADGHGGGLKDLIKIADSKGTSVLEIAAKYLEGFTAALPAIQKTLSTAKTSFQTAIGASGLAGKVFGPIIPDLVAIIQGTISVIKDSSNSVATIVQGAWSRVKDVLFEVNSVTKEITIKPEVMENLKSAGNAFMAFGSLLREVSLQIITHLDLLTKLGVAYLIHKGALGVTAIALNVKNGILGFLNKTQEASNIVNQKAILLAEQRVVAEENLNRVMLQGFANGTGITKAKPVSSTVDIDANVAKTASNLRVTETTLANTQAILANAVATRNSIAVDIEAQKVMVSSLATKIQSASANVRYAETQLAIATANKVKVLTDIENREAEIAYLSASAVSIERQKQLKIETTLLTQAKSRLHGVTVAVTNAENQLGIAQNALTGFTQKQIVATDALIASQRALEVSNRLVGQAAASNTLAQSANTAAKQANSVATEWNTAQQGLFAVGTNLAANMTSLATIKIAAMSVAMGAATIATNLLGAAIQFLVNNWFTALLTALYLGYLAWEKWGNAAEKAKKQAGAKQQEIKDIVEGLEKQNKATQAQIDLEKKINSGIPISQVPEKDKLTVALGSNLSKYEELNKTIERQKGLLNEVGDAEKKELVTSIAQNEALKNRMKDAALLAQKLQPTSPPGMKPVPEVDKKAEREAENAYNTLIKLQDQYQMSAIKAGRSVDELATKLEALDTKLANDKERTKAAFGFDAESTKQAYAYLDAQVLIEKQAIVADANKRVYREWEKADAVRSMQEYRSDLAERKSLLQSSLEARQITQIQYYDLTAKMIEEESAKEILSLQKVVDEKKKLVQDTPSPNYSLYMKAITELTTSESQLDKVRQDASKRYNDNIRQATKYLEEQRKELLKLESKNTVDEAQLKANKSKGTGWGFGAINDQIEAEKAVIKAKYDMERDEIEQKLEMLTGVTDAQLQQIDSVHKAQMAAIDAENKLRISGITDEKLRASESKRYADEKLKIETSYTTEFNNIKVKASKQSLGLISALEKAYNLTYKKEEQEKIEVDKKGNESKMSAIANYAEFGTQALTMLASTQDQASKSGFESAKAFNLGAAVMSTAAAVIAQLTTPGPIGWVKAALAAAIGAVQIAKIASTSFGGGGSASTVPSGSFGASDGTTSSSGLGNLSAPLMSIQDSQTKESFDRLTVSTDNVAVTIGRLSKTMDDLTDLFSKGGAGYSLATNAPGQNANIYTNKSNGLLNPTGNLLPPFSVSGLIETAITVDPVLNALFGGENRTTDSGINLGVNQGQVYGQNYTTTEKGNWWTGSDASTSYVNNPELTKYLMQLTQPYINDITRMATTLGTKVNTANFTGATTAIAIAGRKPEDINKDLEAWTLKVLQGMSLTVEGLKDTVGEYDDAYAKLKLYNDALVSTNTALGLIGKTQLQGSLRTGEFLANMQQSLFGGMEGFNKAVDTYFTSMFTENEQEVRKAIQARELVSSTFKDIESVYGSATDLFIKKGEAQYSGWVNGVKVMGKAVGGSLEDVLFTIPKTKEEFKNIVDALDLTTASGAATFAALMGVSESFATMIDYANKMKQAQLDLDNDVYSRLLRVTDQISAADVYDKVISNQKELKDAQEKGLDTTKLLTVQSLELAKVIKGVAETISEANKKLIESSKQALEDMVSSQQAILNTIKTIMTGPLAQLSPESAYLQAKQQFATADIKDLPSAATALLDASKNYNASSVAYQSDLQMVLAKLGESSGIGSNPTLDIANAQLDKLEEIRKVISTGDITQIANLSGILSNNAQLTSLLTSYLQADAKAKADAQVAAQAAQAQATQASTVAQMNESMQSKAGAIAKEVMNMSVGLVPANMKYDVNKDSAIDIKDALKWQQVSTGSLLWSSLGIPAFRNGGITDGPSIAGEGIYREAVVPLLDGRTIQARVYGEADNKKIEELLEKQNNAILEQNKLLRAQLAVAQAQLEQQEESTKSQKNVENKVKMTG